MAAAKTWSCGTVRVFSPLQSHACRHQLHLVRCRRDYGRGSVTAGLLLLRSRPRWLAIRGCEMVALADVGCFWPEEGWSTAGTTPCRGRYVRTEGSWQNAGTSRHVTTDLRKAQARRQNGGPGNLTNDGKFVAGIETKQSPLSLQN